jgi:cobyrinic acid a,c-diamide synthase
MPGLVIGAPRSGSGKTTLTLGLLRVLARRGVRVVGAKCGPDYIDPAFHAAACGRASVNLDSWAMPPALIGALAADLAARGDLVLCEGLMGLFDGVPAPPRRTGSSADIAALLGWPVLLVLDVSGQSSTAAAIVKGFASYDADVRVAGVVLNRVGSERHRRLAGDAIAAIGVPVLGALPRDDQVRLPERHLGLVQASETEALDAILDAAADFVAAHVDVERVVEVAAQFPPQSQRRHGRPWPGHPRFPSVGRSQPWVAGPSPAVTEGDAKTIALLPPGRRVALATDQAFSFIYPHVLSGWRAAGAEVVPFSPLADEPPPENCDACWLPGGYPELHAARLAGATRFLEGLRRFAATRPVHGECGGYMVLGRALIDAAGKRHEMAGLLSVVTSFARRRMRLGYRDATLLADGPLGLAGTRLRGHEFHYSTIAEPGEDQPFAQVADAHGGAPMPAGGRRGLVSGSYFHAIARVSIPSPRERGEG